MDFLVLFIKFWWRLDRNFEKRYGNLFEDVFLDEFRNFYEGFRDFCFVVR